MHIHKKERQKVHNLISAQAKWGIVPWLCDAKDKAQENG